MKFRMMGAFAAALLGSCVAAHAGDALPNPAPTCANLLHTYPTPAPVEVMVGRRLVFVCQASATGYRPIRKTFDRMSDLAWWRDHTEDRVVIMDGD